MNTSSLDMSCRYTLKKTTYHLLTCCSAHNNIVYIYIYTENYNYLQYYVYIIITRGGSSAVEAHDPSEVVGRGGVPI